MKFSRLKLIQTAKEAELFIYQNPAFYEFENKKANTKPKAVDPEQKKKSRERSLYRSRSHLRRLINNNLSGKPFFLTLTFAENITDLKAANYEFTKFIQRLNYLLGHKTSFLKYVAVPEIQKKREQKYGVGVWHFHLVLFNMPYVDRVYDKLNQIWNKGFLLLENLDNVKNVGAYMSKYMSKGKAEMRLIGQKSYFASKSLNKPVVTRDEKAIMQILETLPKDCTIFEKEYQSEYHGSVTYKHYQLPV